MGFGESWHRDWLETHACSWMHQEQGHWVDRQLVQLEDKGTPQSPAAHPWQGPRRMRLGERGQMGHLAW